MTAGKIRETDLYQPIKTFLESQGYTVKGEIGAADIVAMRSGEDPLVVELKTGFSLSLFHQGIERQMVSDLVYVAVPLSKGVRFRKSLKDNVKLCRRLGIGLLTVRLSDALVQVHCDPGPYLPRKSAAKKALLLKEFAKRQGDPNSGGSTRTGLVTAYRQDVFRCVAVLLDNGPTKAATVAKLARVETARRIMADNHYGWFEKVATGIYGLSSLGQEEARQNADAIIAPSAPETQVDCS
jgi:hypothetical protein